MTSNELVKLNADDDILGMEIMASLVDEDFNREKNEEGDYEYELFLLVNGEKRELKVLKYICENLSNLIENRAKELIKDEMENFEKFMLYKIDSIKSDYLHQLKK